MVPYDWGAEEDDDVTVERARTVIDDLVLALCIAVALILVGLAIAVG